MKRTIQGRNYRLRVWPGQSDTATSPGLAGSIAYAMQRHHETGHPYIVGGYGNVLMDCRENRALLRQDDMGGVVGVTVNNR